MLKAAVIVLLGFGLFCAGLIPAAAAGSWVAESRLPTLRQRGWHYTGEQLRPRPTTPVAGRGITSVSWQYDYEHWDPGLRVALCAGKVCIDASNERGWTKAFSGLPVATVFRFHLMVSGRHMLNRPLQGGPVTLVVNFK